MGSGEDFSGSGVSEKSDQNSPSKAKSKTKSCESEIKDGQNKNLNLDQNAEREAAFARGKSNRIDLVVLDGVSLPLPLFALFGIPTIFYCHFPDKLLVQVSLGLGVSTLYLYTCGVRQLALMFFYRII